MHFDLLDSINESISISVSRLASLTEPLEISVIQLPAKISKEKFSSATSLGEIQNVRTSSPTLFAIFSMPKLKPLILFLRVLSSMDKSQLRVCMMQYSLGTGLALMLNVKLNLLYNSAQEILIGF